MCSKEIECSSCKEPGGYYSFKTLNTGKVLCEYCYDFYINLKKNTVIDSAMAYINALETANGDAELHFKRMKAHVEDSQREG